MKKKLSAAAAVFTLTFSPLAIAQTSQPAATAAPSAAAAAPAPTAPHPKTEAALACIFGMAPAGCDKAFVGGALPVFQHVVWRGGPDPYFRSTQYAGLNDEGDDIWDVKTNSEQTFIIAQPSQDGGIRRMWVLQGPPDRQCINTIPRGTMNLGHISQSCRLLFGSL